MLFRATFFRFTFLMLLMLSSAQLFAASTHSLSVEYAKTDRYLQGQSQRYRYQPETNTLYYTYTANDFWHVGASIWRGSTEERFGDAELPFKEEHKGFGLNVTAYYENWSWHLAMSRSDSELDVRSQSATFLYEEDNQYSDINLTLDHLFAFRFMDVVPSVGLGFQRSKVKATRASVFPGSFALEDQNNEDQESTFGFIGLSVSTWFDLHSDVFLLPNLQLSWTESIEGEATSSLSRVGQGRGQQRRFSAETDSDLEGDGSGFIAVSLALLIEAIQLRVNYVRTVALEENAETTSLELGYSF